MSQPPFRLREATTAADRLAELERFLVYWFGPHRAEYGEPADSLAGMPDPLRRFYAFAGRWPSPNHDSDQPFYTGGGGHHLRAPDAVTARDDGTLDFFMEYQGDWEGLTLPAGDDPPVWLDGCFDAGDRRREKVSDSLSRFLVTHCLTTILYEDENAPCSVSARSGPLVDRFHSNFGPAELLWDAGDLTWPTSCLVYGGQFYLIPYSGGILAHRIQDEYRFGALRVGAVSIMIGDLQRGPHRW
jgi:hypothetical protein